MASLQPQRINLFLIACFALSHFGVHGASQLITTWCRRNDCFTDCATRAEDMVFGQCQWDGANYVKHFCNSNREYLQIIYGRDKRCSRSLSMGLRGGNCYKDMGTGHYFFFSCVNSLNASEQGINADANDQDYVYVIGALIFFLVFLCGIFGGYRVYKRRNCHQNKQGTTKKDLLVQHVQ